MEKISHTRSRNLLPEEQFEDGKLEEKKTRAYSRVVGCVKRKNEKMMWLERYHSICPKCGAFKYLRDCSCGWKMKGVAKCDL